MNVPTNLKITSLPDMYIVLYNYAENKRLFVTYKLVAKIAAIPKFVITIYEGDIFDARIDLTIELG